MNTTQLLEKFQRDGYLLLHNFFDTDLMQRLDALIREHFGDDPSFLHSDEFLEKAKTDVIPWFPQSDGPCEFDLLDDHDELRQLTRTLLGEGWQRMNCMVMFSKQGTAGQAWHQDCAPEHPARYNLNRLVYTSDIDDETGGQIVVVPGSHRRGLLPAGNPWADFEDQQILRPRNGHACAVARPYLASRITHSWSIPILDELPRYTGRHSARRYRCLCLSQHALSVFD